MAKETGARRLTQTQARAARRERRQRRKKYIKVAALSGISMVATLLIVSLFLPSIQFDFGGIGSGSGPGQSVPIQGKAHIEIGQNHPPYNSTPPTSGWHYLNPAAWAVYKEPVPDEIQVHNLEHGGVLVQYNCPEGCDELVQQLTDIFNTYQSLVIVAPYPGMDAKIALTAWGWIDELEDFDEARIVDFINGHANGIHK